MGQRWRTREAIGPDVVILAVVAYVPMLLSSPGRVSADSKQALYLDPDRFLAGAASLWDPSIGAGTVPHQHIGYLWPMGPWFWSFERLGVPDWVAQRLWWGTLVFAAALGMRWLLRSMGAAHATALAGALVYALSPYQLAFTARASVILLPWVGLPWLVELTRRAVRTGGWRHPALAALVIATIAGVNATSLLLVALGPVLVVAHALVLGRVRSAIGATARIALLGAGVSAFWLGGLRVQGTHGMPVLDLTENLSDVARWSNPGDVLRGLGNWFFAGRDRLGWSVDQAEAYLDDPWVIGLTLVIPALALASLAVLQGRVRLHALAAVVLATVVAVGAWPLEAPSLYGRAFRWFAEGTAAGLALRNSHRVVPVLVLGVALILAHAVEALPRPDHRRLASVVVGVAAIATLAPAMVGGFTSRHLDRPESVPSWWVEATDDLDERGADAIGNPRRVLEVPGAPFAAYRWGNTVEPVSAGLMNRPHLAREVLPYGSPATANLLDALDRRMQEGVLEPEVVAPIARLFAASDVLVRSDLHFERFRTPEPASLWSVLSSPVAPDLAIAATYGPPTVNEPDRALAPLDERDLASGSVTGEAVPPVGVLAVDDAPPVLQLLPSVEPVVLAGDGDGIVDAAAAGLLDGRSLVLYDAALDDDQLADALDAGASLVVTDTNRRRIQTWFYAIRDTRGPTERAGERLVEPTTYDVRLDPVDGTSDAARSVVEHLGAQVSASISGSAARPEDRAMAAFDDDLATAWRVGGPDPRGQRLSVAFDEPVPVDSLVLVQPQDGPRDRVLESVRVHLDREETIDIELDDRSLEPSGQPVDIGGRRIAHLELEITGVSDPGFDPSLANAVGFAEVRVGSMEIAETVVLPRALLDRAGPSSTANRLDVVMSRLRYDPFDRGRTDTERHLDRTVELPVAREFGVSGRARLSVEAPDTVLDAMLVTGAETRAAASTRLAGDLGARAWSAIDGDPTTAWTAAFGPQEGQWIQLDFGRPIEVRELLVSIVTDDAHSVPTEIEVAVGDTVVTSAVDVADTASDGGVREVPIVLDASGDSLRITIVGVERRSAPAGEPAPMATLPVAIAEISLPAMPSAGRPVEVVDTGCRTDLLGVDSEALGLRISGPAEAVRTGLDVVACEDLTLGPGRHRMVAVPGHRSGIDLDRLVLSSAAGGGASPPATRGRPRHEAGAAVGSLEAGRTSWTALAETDGEPFWVVLGQSHSSGWTLQVDGVDQGAPILVNGYANGWLVTPTGDGDLGIELEWRPQQTVWWALALSAFVSGLCIGLVVGSTPDRSRASGSSLLGVTPVPSPPDRGRGRLTPVAVGAVGTGLGVAVVSRPWIGIVATGVAMLVWWRPPLRWAVGAVAPAALGAAFVFDRPGMAWLSLAIVVAAAVGVEMATGWPGLRERHEPPREARAGRAPRPSGRGTGPVHRPDPAS